MSLLVSPVQQQSTLFNYAPVVASAPETAGQVAWSSPSETAGSVASSSCGSSSSGGGCSFSAVA